ncbi:PilW family protein [Pseudomonas sp. NA-150]|uniref:PilW family protein n=1 Tax=Pseudomonas sp. NA-150 TaxID=3367525 RepID=UPI0037CACB18
MIKRCRGFGLIEIMIAMTLGLLIMLGLSQLFISVKSTHLSQNASAAMQEDARFALSRLIHEIRMVGMFGCLATIDDKSGSGFAAAQQNPIRWDSGRQALTLVTADVGSTDGNPTWTLYSDCETSATAHNKKDSGVGPLKFPISQVTYTYNRRAREITNLIQNVSSFNVLFGVANDLNDTGIARYINNPPDPSLIRSVRLTLTLEDPGKRVKDQTFSVVAALRNRLG